MSEEATTEQAELVWIQLHVEMSSYHGSGVDDYASIPRTEWEAKSEAEQDEWIQEATEEHLSNTVSAGGWVVDVADVPAFYLSD